MTPWLFPETLCTPLEWRAAFGNSGPVEIDLGAGDGGFVTAYARQHPERNFLAVERLLGRARKIAKKAQRLPLPNLRVLRLESLYTLEHLVAPSSVQTVHLMFPDPWPKARHAARRLAHQGAFRDALARALAPGGEFRLTTDSGDYFQEAAAGLDAHPAFERLPVWDLADYPSTDFQAQFALENRPTHRARWRRAAEDLHTSASAGAAAP